MEIMEEAGTEAVIERLLESKQPVNRCMARGFASGWHDTAETWMKAELAQGTAPAHILSALSYIYVSLLVSATMTTVRPEGFELVATMVKSRVDEAFKVARQG